MLEEARVPHSVVAAMARVLEDAEAGALLREDVNVGRFGK
jgi:hypothetical protein